MNDPCCSHSHASFQGDKQVWLLSLAALFFFLGLFLQYTSLSTETIIICLFMASYLLVGSEVIYRAVTNVVQQHSFDENFLIFLATVGAMCIGQYPEAAAVMLFYFIGENLQEAAVENSKKTIKSLLAEKPEIAHLKKGDEILTVDPESLKVGEIIYVKAGERVPVDGRIVEGRSFLDTSALTGESHPRALEAGQEALAGMINLSGLLTIEVIRPYESSAIARIIHLVEEANARKASTERFMTTFARYYTPAVIFLAVLTAIIPSLYFGNATQWVYRALVLLVISCPCALVLSIPLSYFAAIGKLAREGILVKGAKILETLCTIKTVAFDKTGTITKGKLKVKQVISQGAIEEGELLRMAALAEAYSNHPMAAAIRKAYGEKIDLASVLEHREMAGMGISVRTEREEVMVGNDRMLHFFDIQHDICNVDDIVAHVVINKQYAGYLTVSDELKEESPEAVRELKELGIRKIIMVTGDNANSAREISKEAGIDVFFSELLPEDKVRIINDLKQQNQENGGVAFVGDGINDAPVLAASDVGIGMGGMGSDAAIEAADVVIMDDEPTKLASAIRTSLKTRRIVFQNILFTVGVKAAIIALGVFGEATMWEAIFADVGVSLIAVVNALRIFR